MGGFDPFAVRAMLGEDAAVCRRAVTGEHGVSLPPLHDHHVHSHLEDITALPAGGIAAAVDLGGDPSVLARRERQGMPQLTYAGAFLVPPGGYPSGRDWAPPEIVRIVSGGASGVETAVDEQARFGAALIKVVMHTGGPVFDAQTLAAIVSAGHARGLPVVAHVEGPGMAARAIEAGADAFAHVPFTERLDDAAIAASLGQVWISTLAIHASPERDTAIANAAAFAAAGGRLVYGTDLGNGVQPIGVNAAELHALEATGARGAALVRMLTDPWPRAAHPAGVCTFVAGPPPGTQDEIVDWLTRAVVVPAEELIHDV